MPAIVGHVLEVGAIVAGKYRIERILGMGGMGVVAVATHVQLDQQFALKVVHDAMAEDPAIVERFMREARASAKLKSEHVCRVSDVDQLESGAPFIVMELLDGLDLQKIVQQHVLPIETAASYLLQACIAIAEAHGLGIIHRDLKPANLFVTTRLDGTPLIKVLDFGIAKATADAEMRITQTQAIMGSPGYMSPEQLRSARDVDARSDLWSLGVILYELTTGRLPFIAQTITELAVKVAVDPPAPLPPAMDPRFAAIITRCLEKDLERRYPSVTALANDLAPFAGAAGSHSVSLIARLSGSQPGVSAPRSAVLPMAATQMTGLSAAPPAAAPPPRSSKQPLLIAGAIVLLAGAAFGGYALTRKAEPPPKPAKKPPRDAGSDAPRAIDAGPSAEVSKLEDLRAHKQWAEIIDLAKLAPGDAQLKSAAAEARFEYGAVMLEKLDAQVAAGACPQASATADQASAYIDNATLVAKAKLCVEKRVVAKPGAGSGSGSAAHAGSASAAPPHAISSEEIKQAVAEGDAALAQHRYADAIASVKHLLADSHPHAAAARIAGVASCQLGNAADAKKYADLIPSIGPKLMQIRRRIINACASKKISID